MAIQKTEAFVIKTQPFRSSSLIITFYTQDFGKVRGLAKGVRREREMRGALYELFTHLEIVYYEKTRSDLHLVSEASILETHDKLRTDLKGISYSSYLAELVDAVTEVHDPHEGIFHLLRYSFRFLLSLPVDTLCRLFEIKLLHEIGWLPYLDTCLKCQSMALEGGAFSVREAGLFCSSCSAQVPDARPLKPETLAAMRYFISHDLDSSIRYRISPVSQKELETLMDAYLVFRLGKSLKTRHFLREISPALVG